MEIRHRSRLRQMCANFTSPMQEDSPEILLMQRICAGKTAEACALFGETKQFGGLPAVDAPYGRFEGQAELAVFASGWLKRFGAESASIDPVCQTQSGGRSVTEMNVSFGPAGRRPAGRGADLLQLYPGAGADALPEADLQIRTSGDGGPEPADGGL